MPNRQFVPDVLDAVLKEAASDKTRDIVVFDLDSTLLDNRPRQVAILREYGQEMGLPLVAHFEVESMDGWSLELSLQHCGLSSEEARAHKKQVYSFWETRFFTSQYCLYDVQTQGAADYVREVLKAGARVVYCTGRHEAMKEGTIQNLVEQGFPAPDEKSVFLLLKPYFELEDDDWKKQAYTRISSLGGGVLAVFDNEPSHINGYKVAYPNAICVHLYTDESGRGIAVHPDIPSIYDFVIPVK